jgi:hypothetical protein
MAILARREEDDDLCIERRRTSRCRSGEVMKEYGGLGIWMFECLDPLRAWSRIAREALTTFQSNESAITFRVTHA